MISVTRKAPAKVNYLLEVIRRRPDGYHDLRMIMQRVNLCDDIFISLTESPDITVSCDLGSVPDGPDNIAWKAAQIMLGQSNSKYGADIKIIKKIPVAAGLGGGSSDAATVLMGLNELLSLGLSDQHLMKIGVTLGADVPFFIFKKTALAEGIGDRLTHLPNVPKAFVVLVNPGIPISTAWVYRSLQLTKERDLARIPKFFETVEDLGSIFYNDLESVAVPAFPVIVAIKNCLIDLGATASLMSGSGSTVFGIFSDRINAERALGELSGKAGWFIALAETL